MMFSFSCNTINNVITSHPPFPSILVLGLYILSGCACAVNGEWNNNIQKAIDDTGGDHYRYDDLSKTLHVPILNADSFGGNSLNFHGADLANVHLVNVTIDGAIPHLTIDTLELRSQLSSVASGSRMALVDHRGGLYTADGVKWDKGREMLEVRRLSSLSSSEGLSVHSDLEMNSNVIRNFKLDDGATLTKVRVESSTIVDTTLVNATFEDLTLGSVQVDSFSITSLASKKGKRAPYLTIGDGGALVDSSGLYENDNGSISIAVRTHFLDEVDFHGSRVENVLISSGSIKGDEFDVDARDIKAQSFTLRPLMDSKKHFKDTLAVVRDDGSLTNSNIELEENGWIGDMKISGSIRFYNGEHESGSETRESETRGGRNRGKILGAALEGGTVKELEKLHVGGPSHLENNLDVKGDVFIDGGLTVGGSVLGSGPYIDVSDERLKADVKPISCEGMLEKLTKLQAVHYKLVPQNHSKRVSHENHLLSHKTPEEEVGFIAQDVEEVFPNLVSMRMDGFLGLQYSRFVPLLIEGMKDIQKQLKELQEQNEANRHLIHRLIESREAFH